MAGTTASRDGEHGDDVLLVDDNELILEGLGGRLELQGYRVRRARTAEEALLAVKAGHEGVIVLDVQLPGRSGLQVLSELRKLRPENPIIVVTGEPNIDTLIRADQARPFDFITKAQNSFNRRVLESVAKASRSRRAQRPSGAHNAEPIPGVIASSDSMQKVLREVAKLARSKVSVLVTGPSGTGKELIARAIHDQGERAGRPFIAVNCAGIPETLLESELLGHERGAFTGAIARKIGKFEAAHGGTIFLDEVGEMPMALQSKLLRVLQGGQFERLGGTQTVSVDVRVVSATNRDLPTMIAEGRFRDDLYYRLAVFRVDLPPLRERLGDIEPLVRHIVLNAARSEGRSEIVGVHPEALDLFKRHPWPGNVRELQNVVNYAVVMCEGKLIKLEDLPVSFLREAEGRKAGAYGVGAVSGAHDAVSGAHDAVSGHHSAISGGFDRSSGGFDRSSGGFERSSGSYDPVRVSSGSRPAVQAQPGPADARSPSTPLFPTSAPPGLPPDASIAERLDHAFPPSVGLPTIESLERGAIEIALQRSGSRTATAELLGISRATLYRRLAEFEGK
jgi:DNA-binding NtrC family response regulator